MERKIAKHIIIYLLICIPLYFLCWGVLNLNGTTEIEYRYETITETEPRVYVTTYGEKYHNASCSYLQSSHARGLYQAKKQGYTACSRCGGRSSGTINVSYQEQISYEVEKDNEITAIPIALLVGIFPYLLIKGWLDNREETQ